MADPRTEVVIFDVVGTLFDVAPVEAALVSQGAPAGMFEAWFERLLHSAATLTLIGEFAPFGEIARSTLATTSARIGIEVDIDAVLASFRQLPLQAGAREAVAALVEASVPVAALTNSSADQARSLLERSGVLGSFAEVLSVEAVRRYKPDPSPYRHALERLGVPATSATFIAAHAWDVAGAANVGMTGVWVGSHERVWPLPARAGVGVADLRAAADLVLAGLPGA